MAYKCEQCNKPVKCIRWVAELMKWLCDKCYFNKDEHTEYKIKPDKTLSK